MRIIFNDMLNSSYGRKKYNLWKIVLLVFHKIHIKNKFLWAKKNSYVRKIIFMEKVFVNCLSKHFSFRLNYKQIKMGFQKNNFLFKQIFIKKIRIAQS